MMLLGQIDTQPAEEFKTMFDINVIALLNGMQAVLALMKARNTGTIINISSIAGRKTFGAHAAYCGTKFAVHAITENVREEVAMLDVRVIIIAPYYLDKSVIYLYLIICELNIPAFIILLCDRNNEIPCLLIG